MNLRNPYVLTREDLRKAKPKDLRRLGLWMVSQGMIQCPLPQVHKALADKIHQAILQPEDGPPPSDGS